MKNPAIKNSAFKKTAASWLLAILLFNLIFAGLAIPQKKAQAWGGDWANYFLNAAKWTWDKVTWAYEKASDAITSGVAAWEKSHAWYVEAIKAAWNVLRKKMLDVLVDDIVDWINGTDGKSLYIHNWEKYMNKVVDDAAGNFIRDYLHLDLCETFKPSLSLLLEATKTTFDQNVACTLEGVEKNLSDFYKDFGDDGWKTWAKISQGQNNLYGAYFFGVDQLSGQTQKALNNATQKAISSAGFLGDEVCVERTCTSGSGKTIWTEEAPTGGWKNGKETEVDETKYAGATCKCSETQTRTPGKIVADTTAKTAGLDIDWLISADEFNEYLGAIVDAGISRITRNGILGLGSIIKGDDDEKNSIRNSAPSVNVNPEMYADTQENQNLTIAFVKELNRINQNLAVLQKQGRANLKFMEENLKRQQLVLDSFGWVVSHGCNGAVDELLRYELEEREIDAFRMTDISNPSKISTLHDFPKCGVVNPATNAITTKVKIEFDRIGQIIFLLNPDPSSCAISVESKQPQILNLQNDYLQDLRYRFSPNETTGQDRIDEQIAKTQMALASIENFRTSEENYYKAKEDYLKMGNIDPITGQLDMPGLPPELAQDTPQAIAAATAKEIMDKNLSDAIEKTKIVIAALAQKDSKGNFMSVSINDSKNTNLPQLHREIQEISSEIADQAGNAETLRGISQTDPIRPSPKCTEEQRTGNTLTSDLCYITDIEKDLLAHFFGSLPKSVVKNINLAAPEAREIYAKFGQTIPSHMVSVLQNEDWWICHTE
ncbi:MAG: hypothetical protein UV67_C0010G0012 [Parcubacteria group bacterium GW2011_GWC1_43_12]|nr:MAG: hypothetical protein UV34_C0007G0004 [Parcubacteria group bacterium GW2011_GWB1_42_6]KKS92107.1 MAG: hypothetical protein UV67_C0010G0012 [Parcubacteria group bacterium GW2011_GWC1_43_12]